MLKGPKWRQWLLQKETLQTTTHEKFEKSEDEWDVQTLAICFEGNMK